MASPSNSSWASAEVSCGAQMACDAVPADAMSMMNAILGWCVVADTAPMFRRGGSAYAARRSYR